MNIDNASKNGKKRRTAREKREGKNKKAKPELNYSTTATKEDPQNTTLGKPDPPCECEVTPGDVDAGRTRKRRREKEEGGWKEGWKGVSGLVACLQVPFLGAAGTTQHKNSRGNERRREREWR